MKQSKYPVGGASNVGKGVRSFQEVPHDHKIEFTKELVNKLYIKITITVRIRSLLRTRRSTTL